ncbi:MAG: hypothetical protein K2N18_00610, partial [Clostridia bacterium]|nr:hypothetical protein [Clostridia bacterium]
MTEKNKEQMLEMLDIMLDEDIPYNERLEAYEYLLEDCEEIVDVMLEKSYGLEGDTGKMLMEVLAQYKGNKAIFMGLVSYLYKGDDVALFAKLIGSYGDEQGVQVLKTFCDEYEPNYNEYMELRNAVEELGGDFDLQEDFSDDPLYRYLKGLDDEDDRKSPFEGLWQDEQDESDGDGCCDDDCDCHHEHHHDDCDCHHHEGEDCGCDHSHEHEGHSHHDGCH